MFGVISWNRECLTTCCMTVDSCPSVVRRARALFGPANTSGLGAGGGKTRHAENAASTFAKMGSKPRQNLRTFEPSRIVIS